jgi:hypothetical protein
MAVLLAVLVDVWVRLLVLVWVLLLEFDLLLVDVYVEVPELLWLDEEDWVDVCVLLLLLDVD